MKSGRQEQITGDPVTKDKFKKDNESAHGISVKSKAARGCRKSGTSVGKASKQRRKTTGNDNGYYLHLPPTPLHPQSPAMTSISIQNTPLKVQTPVSVQSPHHLQKFQLQLFPMDEPTRNRLEEENHCPYLELTITSKKKIASVIRHLNMKWGNSRGAFEELFLFPYDTRLDSLESYNRWTLKDSEITAADVHAAIGKPAVFRLRYKWLRIFEPKTSNLSRTYQGFSNQEKVPGIGVSQECEPLPAVPLLKHDVLKTASLKRIQAAENLRPNDDVNLSWVDCVSNMSFGALLSEVEEAEGAKFSIPAPHKQISISCDSFDAAIAAHIVRYQTGNQSTTIAQPSILDAEETCNPFSFHNLPSVNKNIPVRSQATHVTSTGANAQHHGVRSPPVEPLNTNLTSEADAQPIQEENNQLAVDWQGNKQEKEDNQVDINKTNNVNNQFEGLDMHWPPSAGPWQYIASSSPQQIISSDSSSLNGFASTSLGIF